MALLITDFDGKILFLDKESEYLLMCQLEEVFNKKRIFNFLDPEHIIEFSNIFLNKNEIETILITKKSILLKVLFKKKKTISFEITENKKEKKITEKIIKFEKLKIIIRSKFIIGSMIPLLFSVFWIYFKYKELNFYLIPLLFISLFFLHAAANTFNDYYDWKSGRDKQNLDYILFSTGGSRALDFKFISEKKLLVLSFINLSIPFLIGIYFIYIKGYTILIIGLVAFFSVYFYSAPPIHLASRYGLGELMHVFCLGPLINLGSVILLTKESANFEDFFIGLPFGLVITGCLLINECPDSKFDKLNGKFNLPAYIGIKYIPYLYSLLIISAFISVFTGILIMDFPKSFYFMIFMLPYTYKILKDIFKIKESKEHMQNSCIKSLNLYIIFSILLTICIIINFF